MKNCVSFYLEEDEATNKWWNRNNELNKPNHHASPSRGYFLEGIFGNDREAKLHGSIYFTPRDVIEDHEYMSFVSKSRTASIGAEPRTRGIVEMAFDLDYVFGFDDKHGAQFDFAIQKTISKSESNVFMFYQLLHDNLKQE